MPSLTRFARLCGAATLAYCSYQICRSPLLPLFARHLGAGPSLVGLTVGASTLTGVLVKLPAGALSDVAGRGRLLVAGCLVFALAPFGYLGVSSLAVLIALRVAHGHATAIFGPVASAAISDFAPADRRGAWLGTYSTLQGAGQAVGPLLAGALLAGGSYGSSFVVSGGLGCAALLLVAGWPRERRLPAVEPWWRQARAGAREVARDARVLATGLAEAGQFLLNGALGGFLPLFAADALGLGTLRIGSLVALQTVVTLLARPLLGVLSDRLGRRPLIAGGLGLCAVAVWTIAGAHAIALLAVAVSSYGLGLALTTAATSAYITDLTPPTRYGAAHGIFGTIYDIGDAAGPIVGGALVSVLGYRGMFRTLAVTTALVALAFAASTRVRRGGERPPGTRFAAAPS